jgi:nondiscriminating glutamyl-tRNA synthetase
MDKIKATVKTRFAPSPTGIMHFGNIRTALFNYLFAKKHKGEFLLRVEDTDKERSTKEYVTAILEDLKALNLIWDGAIIYQSERANIYNKFYLNLIDQDLIYPCFCSEEKLAVMRKIQLSQKLPPRYAGICLKLTKEEINTKLANKERVSYRFKVPKDIQIIFKDLVKGQQVFNSNDFGDFIIKRQDGTAPFMFCNAIDDAVEKVTHALRGEDHLSNTPRQLLILQALKLKAPEYGHFPLINGTDGLPLSKRGGSKSIKELLLDGYLPETLLNYLARLGHNYPLEDNTLNKVLSLNQLSYNFSTDNISLHAARHDLNHLNYWQKQAMLILNEIDLLQILQKDLDFCEIFKNNNQNNQLDNFLQLIKSNIIMPKEAVFWAKAFFADLISEDANNILNNINPDFLKIIINNIKNNNFSELIDLLKQGGFSGKNLFVRLRALLTGQTYGPELHKIFELVGSDRLKNRAIYILNKISHA